MRRSQLSLARKSCPPVPPVFLFGEGRVAGRGLPRVLELLDFQLGKSAAGLGGRCSVRVTSSFAAPGSELPAFTCALWEEGHAAVPGVFAALHFLFTRS